MDQACIDCQSFRLLTRWPRHKGVALHPLGGPPVEEDAPCEKDGERMRKENGTQHGNNDQHIQYVSDMYVSGRFFFVLFCF